MIDTAIVLDAIYNSELIAETEFQKIEPYCQATCEQLSQRLKSEDYADVSAVIMACVGVTLYNFLLANGTIDDFSSFKAGDVTVTQNRQSRIENASKFKDEVLICASPYLTDIDFIFKAVEV